MRAVRIGAGLVVFGCALIIGLLPLSSRGVECGSALHATSEAAAVDSQASLAQRDLVVTGDLSAEQRCDNLRKRVRIPMVALAVGACLAPLTVRRRARRRSA